MVKLTRIYTRTGDAGTTKLSDFSDAAKTDARVQAYGHVDEANSIIGVALAQPDLPTEVAEVLRHIQNELFDCGADLSNPLKADDEESLRIIQPYVDRLERWCDEFSEGLPELQSFILPGGSGASAWLQVARTVVRRAERTAWAAASIYGNKPATEERPGGVNLLALAYLNRLSDLLFILARVAGQQVGEVLWVPGKDRLAPNPKAARLRESITGDPESQPSVDQEAGVDLEVADDQELADDQPVGEPASPATPE
ncbi:MAG: cob(I)yrinic acid a,c-diamide adenosyltransferase [Actinobacteria bacterium]|nr:cob(I)yrinic acid a,c-diamide adenosyltransferase [Propionicimonas sp.]MBU3977454.1 cob(I)yrinic acid a,c-diamide adenosyltransferase [Actinomycetota bacterium]MBU3985964.1 cob(I)yrinic acid a,c-diamide adenosyltransferase [Actinomycetota bacterium]MBU4008749.1 cob(I)yrinic acid a,c-diamide adenosyltransferase [Actinomycetota bacterium]MBU4066101.1 cob(I)yrinic acid a,c-diamide adenosyltransferase [Actinomycetota bacterium]